MHCSVLRSGVSFFGTEPAILHRGLAMLSFPWHPAETLCPAANLAMLSSMLISTSGHHVEEANFAALFCCVHAVSSDNSDYLGLLYAARYALDRGGQLV